MKNLAAVVIFLIVIAVLVKYGFDRYLTEMERHNQFIEDRIDRDGLHYTVKIADQGESSEEVSSPEIEATEVSEEGDPQAVEESEVVASENGSSIDPEEEVIKDPRFLHIEKVSEAVKAIYEGWNLKSNKVFEQDIKAKSQKEFVIEYNEDVLGEEIRNQFGLASKKSGLNQYYISQGVKSPDKMSERILVQLYRFVRNTLNAVT